MYLAPRVMAEAVTRTLGGSAACTREAEPPQRHDLARAKSRGRGNEVTRKRSHEETKSRGNEVTRNNEEQWFD